MTKESLVIISNPTSQSHVVNLYKQQKIQLVLDSKYICGDPYISPTKNLEVIDTKFKSGKHVYLIEQKIPELWEKSPNIFLGNVTIEGITSRDKEFACLSNLMCVLQSKNERSNVITVVNPVVNDILKIKSCNILEVVINANTFPNAFFDFKRCSIEQIDRQLLSDRYYLHEDTNLLMRKTDQPEVHFWFRFGSFIDEGTYNGKITFTNYLPSFKGYCINLVIIHKHKYNSRINSNLGFKVHDPYAYHNNFPIVKITKPQKYEAELQEEEEILELSSGCSIIKASDYKSDKVWKNFDDIIPVD